MSQSATFDRIERDPTPSLHADGQAHWDISPEVLATIDRLVKPGMRTLETGAGRSTLHFLAAGAEHTAITVEPEEVSAITREAIRQGIKTDQLSVELGFSHHVLPNVDADPLDFALIDGGHGFPVPAIDYAYIAPRLKVGGYLLIDDVDLWTGKMIVDFLKAEPGWAFEGLLRRRSALFRVTAPVQLREWTNQPHVVRASRISQNWRKVRNLMDLVLSGDFSAIRGKFAKEKALANAARDDY